MESIGPAGPSGINIGALLHTITTRVNRAVHHIEDKYIDLIGFAILNWLSSRISFGSVREAKTAYPVGGSDRDRRTGDAK
jgi:hypothetical protein